MVLAAVPVKRFFVAKRRLAPVLDAETRSALGRDLALHTLEAMAATGVDPLVLAADEEVADWAKHQGYTASVDQGEGLDEAARGAARRAASDDRPWMIVHADLPLLTPADVAVAIDVLAHGATVIAPSNDGGTSLIGGGQPIPFAYGPGSFRRHLAALDDPTILVRLGLALDLDDPSDLQAALTRHHGRWLHQYADAP